MKKYCEECGFELEENVDFCENCGTRVSKTVKDKTDEHKIEKETIRRRKKKVNSYKRLITILAVFIIICLVGGVAIYIINRTHTEKRANANKTSSQTEKIQFEEEASEKERTVESENQELVKSDDTPLVTDTQETQEQNVTPFIGKLGVYASMDSGEYYTVGQVSDTEFNLTFPDGSVYSGTLAYDNAIIYSIEGEEISVTWSSTDAMIINGMVFEWKQE